jgi:hypothetical protein
MLRVYVRSCAASTPAVGGAFAAAVATMSRRKAATSDAEPHLAKLATASTAWAQHRTS